MPNKVNAININASSAILMDIDSHRILYSKDIHNIRSVASISKVMTAILAIESGKLDEEVVIGEEINKAYGSGIYIKTGEKLKLRDLIYGLMLRSGNDAALAIANFVSKDTESFVKLMNEKANEIGMNDTTFNNPSGLDEEKGNYSSAYDMALLMSYAYKNDDFKKITGTKKYTLKTNMNTYVWNNKNKLLSSYKYTTGGKTGYTKIAKRTLVTTASKNGLNLVVVTLNDGNDWNDHKNLFEYGFNNYKKHQILNKNNFKIDNEKYYKNYNLYIKNNYYYPTDITEEENITIKINLKKIRKIKNNTKVGEAIIYLGDKKLHMEDIFIGNKNFSFIKIIEEISNDLW
jgi:D-alanyl-D-alanine carboxypeptidase